MRKLLYSVMAVAMLFGCSKRTNTYDEYLAYEAEHLVTYDSCSTQLQLNQTSMAILEIEQTKADHFLALLEEALPESADALKAADMAFRDYIMLLYASFDTVVCGPLSQGSAAPMMYNMFGLEAEQMRTASFIDLYFEATGSTNPSTPTFAFVSEEQVHEAYKHYQSIVHEGVEETDGEQFVQTYSAESQRSALRREEAAWVRWMRACEAVTSTLSAKQRTVYEVSLSYVRRCKLISLKNLYQGYGISESDGETLFLPLNCSDAELEAYPGYDVVWDQLLISLGLEPIWHKQ